MATDPDPEQALTEGSPALVALILALGGAIAGRVLPRRPLLTRAAPRRDTD